MRRILLDLKYAARTLGRSPGFTVASVLKPLPYRDPGRRVVALHEGRFPVSPADFFDYQSQVHAFDGIAAAQAWGGYLAGRDKTEVVSFTDFSGRGSKLSGYGARYVLLDFWATWCGAARAWPICPTLARRGAN